jgi:hypothetical protein
MSAAASVALPRSSRAENSSSPGNSERMAEKAADLAMLKQLSANADMKGHRLRRLALYAPQAAQRL